MSSNLIISKPALRDIEAITGYLAEQSGLDRTDKFLSQLDIKFAKIAKFSKIGRERKEILPKARSLAIESYLILYALDDKKSSFYA